MLQTTSSSSGGASFFTLLGLVFIVLKLTGVINWSWWWVLLPFYGGFAFLLVFVLVLFLIDIFF